VQPPNKNYEKQTSNVTPYFPPLASGCVNTRFGRKGSRHPNDDFLRQIRPREFKARSEKNLRPESPEGLVSRSRETQPGTPKRGLSRKFASHGDVGPLPKTAGLRRALIRRAENIDALRWPADWFCAHILQHPGPLGGSAFAGRPLMAGRTHDTDRPPSVFHSAPHNPRWAVPRL